MIKTSFLLFFSLSIYAADNCPAEMLIINEKYKNEEKLLRIKAANDAYQVYKKIDMPLVHAKTKKELLDEKPSIVKINQNKIKYNDCILAMKMFLDEFDKANSSDKLKAYDFLFNGGHYECTFNDDKQFPRSFYMTINEFNSFYIEQNGSFKQKSKTESENKKKMKVILSDGRVIEE